MAPQNTLQAPQFENLCPRGLLRSDQLIFHRDTNSATCWTVKLFRCSRSDFLGHS